MSYDIFWISYESYDIFQLDKFLYTIYKSKSNFEFKVKIGQNCVKIGVILGQNETSTSDMRVRTTTIHTYPTVLQTNEKKSDSLKICRVHSGRK